MNQRPDILFREASSLVSNLSARDVRSIFRLPRPANSNSCEKSADSCNARRPRRLHLSSGGWEVEEGKRGGKEGRREGKRESDIFIVESFHQLCFARAEG